MKKYWAFLVLALVTAASFGQSVAQDVVYLKNGSIIRGVILENIPNKSIKIETADRSVFVYQTDEIEKLATEIIPEKKESPLTNQGFQPGYKGIVELGFQTSVKYLGTDRFILNIINGFQVSPYFSFGFGTGLQYYRDVEAYLVPVFIDFRANLMIQKVSPYLALGLGYSYDPKYDFSGVGFLLTPTIGVCIAVSGKSKVYAGIGYEMQKMEYHSYQNDWLPISVNLGAMSMNVGISF